MLQLNWIAFNEDYTKAGNRLMRNPDACITGVRVRSHKRAVHCPDMPTRQFPYPTDTLQRNTKLRKQEQR